MDDPPEKSATKPVSVKLAITMMGLSAGFTPISVACRASLPLFDVNFGLGTEDPFHKLQRQIKAKIRPFLGAGSGAA